MTLTLAMPTLFAKKGKWTMSQALRRFFGLSRDTRGSAGVEFAIIGPAFALMLVGTADFSLGVYHKMQVQNAAQAGAQYAAVNGFNASSISSAVLAATSYSGIASSPAPIQFCGCPSATGVTSATCGSACAGGSTAGTYVTASAQATYTTILAYPGIPSSFIFTGQSTVKIQ
jgi:Flp pilus assembly protein TadG